MLGPWCKGVQQEWEMGVGGRIGRRARAMQTVGRNTISMVKKLSLFRWWMVNPRTVRQFLVPKDNPLALVLVDVTERELGAERE